MDKRDGSSKLAAAEALASLQGTDWEQLTNRAIETLVKAFDTRNRSLREKIVNTLGNIGAGRTTATDTLIRALSDSESAVRVLAAYALGKHGGGARKAVPLLIAMSERGTADERATATEAIAAIGIRKSGLLQVFTKALEDLNPAVRSGAVFALGVLFKRTPSVLPLVISSLSDPHEEVRLQALVALASCGKRAITAKPALVRAANDPNRAVRRQGIEVLWRLTRDRSLVVPLLMAQMKSEGGCSEGMCDLIAKVGRAASPLVPHLTDALRRGDYDLKWAAASALGGLGADAKAAIPDLVRLLGHKNGIIAGSASTTLARIGRAAIPALLQTLRDRDCRFRKL